MAADGASVSGHDRGAVGSEAAARRRLGRNAGRRALSDCRRHLCKHNTGPCFETRYPHLLLSAGAGACSNALAAHPQLFLTAGRSAANPPATDAAVSGGFREGAGGAAAPPLASFRKIHGLPISNTVRTADSTIIIITNFTLQLAPTKFS